jgi:hypothetical protein
MAVLRWDTINRNQNSDLIKTLVANNQQIGDSLKGLGTTADEYVTNKTDQNTKDFMGQLMAAETDAERSAMIDAAKNQDFLDFGAIGEKNYELGADGRALQTQLAAEDRANTRADEVNIREFEENKQAIIFADNLADGNTRDDLNNELYLTNIKNINDNNILDKEVQARIDALDADFKKTEETAIRVAKEEEAKLVLRAADEQAKLEIKTKAAADLKIKLDAQKKAYEKEKLRIANVRSDNESYRKELASIPSGIDGIFSKAAGGGEHSTDTTGYDSNDIQSYASMRTKVLSDLNIAPEDVELRAEFDRWAADNITFNNNAGLLGVDMNDFSFSNTKGETVRFGYGQTGFDVFETDERDMLGDAFRSSKIAFDVKADVFAWYDKREEGTASQRTYNALFNEYKSELGEGEVPADISISSFKAWLEAEDKED